MNLPTLTGFFQTSPFEPGEDPKAAPSAYQGLHRAPAWTARRAAQNWIWIYAFGLVFLIFAFAAVDNGDPHLGSLLYRVALIVAIGVAYLFAALVCDAPRWVRWAYIGAFVGLLALTSPFMGWGFVNFGIYVSILMSTLIPWRQARSAIVVWGVLIMVVAAVTREWLPLSVALTGVGIGLGTGAGIESGRISTKLSRAEQQVSVLAVAAERERIGRDLHDILGHSLTAISIKAGLAAKLIEHDADAARTQIAAVQEIARQSLADVRSTASGFRETRVVTEVASARSILMAAGIEGRVPSAIEPMPADQSELFGYVVREAVTNVIRHSEATICSIQVSATEVSISDDGTGFRGRTAPGSGLKGLESRVLAAHGTFSVTSRPGGGTVVRAQRSVATDLVDPSELIPVEASR